MSKPTVELLVVDEDESSREFLRQSLTEAGYAVKLVADCEGAWQILDSEQQHFSGILLDRMMQRQGGMGLLARLKSDRRFADIPVIFQTDIDHPLDIVTGIKAGAFYYLVQPVNKEMLFAIVQSAVSNYRLADNLRYVANPEHAYLHNMLLRSDFQLRTLLEARTLAYSLSSYYPQPKRAFLGLSELLINAVEHGNLGIGYQMKSRLLHEGGWEAEIERRLDMPEHAGKKVEVQLERSQLEIRLTISDCGEGFDSRPYMEMSLERAFDLNGRGIAISRMVSFDTLEYLGKGNRLVAAVKY